MVLFQHWLDASVTLDQSLSAGSTHKPPSSLSAGTIHNSLH